MPSIGKDLAAIRSNLELTIQDIQYATKIPVSTLTAIENDSIFEMQDEGKTYIRSFIRSYGRALKIQDEILIKALDQFEAGNYNHLLLQHDQDLTKKSDSEKADPGTNSIQEEYSSTEENVADNSKSHSELSDTEITSKGTSETDQPSEHSITEELQPKANTAPKVTATSVSASGEPDIKNVDWANLGQKFSKEKSKAPTWLISLIILLLVTAGGFYLLHAFGFFSSDSESANEVSVTGNQNAPGSLSLDVHEPEERAPDQEIGATLEDILYVTIYAAFERLDPVRVWSDLKPRLDPYWLEQGVALQFEFTDTVRIRGNYPNMLLFKNGHLIERFYDETFSETENALELTRSFFNSDPKWATPIPLELPEGVAEPDTIGPRPSF